MSKRVGLGGQFGEGAPDTKGLKGPRWGEAVVEGLGELSGWAWNRGPRPAGQEAPSPGWPLGAGGPAAGHWACRPEKAAEGVPRYRSAGGQGRGLAE